MNDLEADAAGTAELLHQHKQDAVDQEKRSSSLQAELTGKAEALFAAQTRITELDQERSDTAARVAACDQELAATKASRPGMSGTASAASLALCSIATPAAPCLAM